jgi:hypothetical protein
MNVGWLTSTPNLDELKGLHLLSRANEVLFQRYTTCTRLKVVSFSETQTTMKGEISVLYKGYYELSVLRKVILVMKISYFKITLVFTKKKPI